MGSTHMSMYTLSLISVERWYAIKNAIQLEKRMTKKTCKLLILFGWIFSFVMAAIPLFDINTYKKAGICLPLSNETLSDQLYLGAVLAFYMLAFIIVVLCYYSMWRSVQSNHYSKKLKIPISKIKTKYQKVFKTFARNGISSKKVKRSTRTKLWKDEDSRIAKRMSVLVFTNFISFFPICVLTISAFFGKPLVSMSTAKVFLVVLYPLNSCCNPFLYAILTKSFRKDLMNIFGINKVFDSTSFKANEVSSKLSLKKVSPPIMNRSRKEKEPNLITSL